MGQSPRRRWFQFSLRTLFAAIAVVGCWLSWSLRWMGQRTEFLAEQKAQYVARGGNPTHEWTAGFAGSARAPGLLWIFGEAGYRALQFDVVVENYQPDRPHGSYPEIQREMRRAARLFPEAKVFDIEPVPRAKYEELKKR